MPIIDATTPPPDLPPGRTQPLHRIENVGANTAVVQQAIQNNAFERLLYAEGDSWFDKFTPIPQTGTNLLEALRLPAFAGLVDASHIGDTSREIVTGWQRRRTKEMFRLFDFDAILLSAGGNDLKNLFAALYFDLGEQREGRAVVASADRLRRAQHADVIDEFFDGVVDDVRAFIALRDEALSERTRAAPLFLHGYDHLQPRPAGARIFAATGLGAGPWLYPSLKHAGLDDGQMLSLAQRVVDELNERLRALVLSLGDGANVWFVDQRGLLTLAAPGSEGLSGDWIDEIHPSAAGFAKLAAQRWNPWLAQALGLV